MRIPQSTSKQQWTSDGNNNIYYTDGYISVGTPTANHKLQVDGYITPTVDNVYGLGYSNLRWQDLYLGPSSLKFRATSDDSGFNEDVAFDLKVDSSNNELQISDSYGMAAAFKSNNGIPSAVVSDYNVNIPDDGIISATGISGSGVLKITGTWDSFTPTTGTDGAAGSGTTSTAIKKPSGSSNYTTGDLNCFVRITSGSGSGEVRRVISNTADTITVHSISGLSDGDTFELVTPGTDLNSVTLESCATKIEITACNIDRLISRGNYWVYLSGCSFDTSNINGSILSERDTYFDINDGYLNNSASLVAQKDIEVGLNNIITSGSTIQTSSCLSVGGEIYAAGASSTPIHFKRCNTVLCGIESNDNTDGADGVLVESCMSFASSGTGITGTGNAGYGIRVDGVGCNADVSGADITGDTGDIVLVDTEITWANLNSNGTYENTGARISTGKGLVVDGNVEIVSPGQLTTNGNFNQAGRLGHYGYQHDNFSGSDISLTAQTGGGQGSATQLGAQPVSRITTVASPGDSVKLPSGAAGLMAKKIVINSGSNALDIFPASGHEIDSLGSNVAYSLAAGKAIEFYAISASAWVSVSWV